MISAVELEILRSEMPGLVRNYRQTRPYEWKWSCDICNDSMKDRRKARFGVAKVGTDLLCHCFNCDWAGSFYTYLKYQHPDLATRVNRTKYVENFSSNAYNLDKIIAEVDSDSLVQLFYINKFADSKQWLKELEKRKIRFSDKESIRKLYNLHKEIHHGKRSTEEVCS